MRLTIAGVHMDTGDALRQYTEEKTAGLETYFDKLTEVNVAFRPEAAPSQHTCELTVHGSGLMLRAEGEGSTWYACLDNAMEKLLKQIQKYKGKLEKRRADRRDLKEQVAFDMVTFVEAELPDNDGIDRAFAEFAPQIVRKEVGRLAPMSVDDAVMQMDLLHKPAFLFVNHDTNELNMVYREGENSVRWVAPRRGSAE